LLLELTPVPRGKQLESSVKIRGEYLKGWGMAFDRNFISNGGEDRGYNLK
jgi:hypothetical protein